MLGLPSRNTPKLAFKSRDIFADLHVLAWCRRVALVNKIFIMALCTNDITQFWHPVWLRQTNWLPAERWFHNNMPVWLRIRKKTIIIQLSKAKMLIYYEWLVKQSFKCDFYTARLIQISDICTRVLDINSPKRLVVQQNRANYGAELSCHASIA